MDDHQSRINNKTMLDTVKRIETPEGIELELRLAGPIVRSIAWLIDAVIRSILYIVLSIIFSLLGKLGLGLMFIAFFFIEWFYPVLFEVTSGSTPGKKAIGVMVIDDHGCPLGWPASLLRNLLMIIDFMPFFYTFGLLSMLINSDFKRLGDLAAGTLVVYRQTPQQRIDLPDAVALRLPLPLRLEEQRTILEFAERTNVMSAPRCEELAELTTALSHAHGRTAVDRLLGYAHWMVHGRSE